MEAGDTFLLSQVDDHLWVVLSDPDRDADRVLVVSVTTWRDGKDPACMVERGEHPFVTHRSCLAYVEARVLSRDNFFTFKDGGLLKSHQRVSPELLARMREGAARSGNLKPALLEILRQQGLVP
jgi:hypothetical protein